MGELLLDPDVYYRMTPRNFLNALAGYRRKEDLLSRERWMIARKMMYAALAPYAKSLKETEIMEFPWEENLVKELNATEVEEMRKQIEENEKFWARWDAKKASA